MSRKDYFSTKKEPETLTGEIVPAISAQTVIQESQSSDLKGLSFFKRIEVMRDAAEGKADHFKKMGEMVHEYQQKEFRNQMDAQLQSRGKQIVAETAMRDASINRRLAELDETEKEFFEEYIFKFTTGRTKKYNQRLRSVQEMETSGDITPEQMEEINTTLKDLKKDIDDSFIDGVKDIMRKNLELRDKIIVGDD